ncbi:hypothetical protein D8Y20_10825 [Mariprofundus sp. EBB-1]|uniref:M48 family metalloprotease n=1 Tax=Mariprofundus sp. EBB-1 TaxID=2650971 RepID=UPI000EF1F0E4|nr:M48 family metalloprotease [Mariprofundus sp. EBB-1]RLL50875.1 hypothetical protein D8Y20_10825 [Mariprofundus sp. EBB-1]
MDAVSTAGFLIPMQLLLTIFAITILIIAVKTAWIVWHLEQHPHMEPLTLARPTIAPFIETMTEQISKIAEITAPSIYILRSQHPNAFIFSPFKRRRLILTDELLEEADQRSDGVEFLKKIICHEIAHIALKHGPRLYILKLMEDMIPVTRFHNLTKNRLNTIETEADQLAETLFEKLSTTNPE